MRNRAPGDLLKRRVLKAAVFLVVDRAVLGQVLPAICDGAPAGGLAAPIARGLPDAKQRRDVVVPVAALGAEAATLQRRGEENERRLVREAKLFMRLRRAVVPMSPGSPAG